MKFKITFFIIALAFLLSLSGFILSMASPENDVSDLLMIAGLFSTAATSILPKIVTKSFKNSRQWKYIVIGIILILCSLIIRSLGFDFLHQIFIVSGSTIAIVTSLYYFYLRSHEFNESKWLWFIPFIFLGYLFKYMRWYGANIIILTCLLFISIIYLVQFIVKKRYSGINILLLLWLLTMCACIGVFTLRYVSSDYFVIGSVFTWLALIDILLQNEGNLIKSSDPK